MFTVAILAQGTNWADAVTQAYIIAHCHNSGAVANNWCALLMARQPQAAHPHPDANWFYSI